MAGAGRSSQHTGTPLPVVNYYVSAHQAYLPTDGGTVVATTQPGATASVQYPQVSAEKSFGSSPQPILPLSSHHHGDPQSPHLTSQYNSPQLQHILQQPLDSDSLLDVLRQLVTITHKWFDLGLVLGLKPHTLRKIKAENPGDIDSCKCEMMKDWLIGVDGCTPSWKSLVDALRDNLINREDIALNIEKSRSTSMQPHQSLFPLATQQRKLNDRVQQVLLQAAYNGQVRVLQKAMETPGILLMEVPTQADSEADVSLSIDSSRFNFCDGEHYSPLMYACEENHLEVVRVIVDCGANVWYTDKVNGGPGLNAVHIACIKGHLEVLKLLLNIQLRDSITAKKHLNAGTRKDGLTPLMYAVKNGHLEIVKYLLQSGYIDMAATSKKKQNVLHIAAHEQQLECLKELHESLPSDDLYFTLDKKEWNILHHACAGGDVEVLKWLFANVPELNTGDLLNAAAKNGYTLLLFACEYQKSEIVELLLENEVVDACACAIDKAKDPTKPSGLKTGLHLAASHDSPGIAELLIDKGCPLGIQDAKGNTALHIACRINSLDVIEVLRRVATEEVLALRNEEKQTQAEVQPEKVIPIEIMKRGSRAVEAYRRALKTGKKKIPRCNLLILGEQEVGKTSLVRLLTGKDFIPNLDRTHGIDNTVVDTVDIRSIDTTHWEVVKPEDQARENNELFVSGVMESLDTKLLIEEEPGAMKKPRVVSEQHLMNDIDSIVAERERLLNLPPPPVPLPHLPPRLHVPPAPRMPVPYHLADLQPPLHTSTAKPPTTPPISTAVKREEPKRDVQLPRAEKPRPPPDPVVPHSIRPHTEPKKEERPPHQSGRRRSSLISHRQGVLIGQRLKSGHQKKKEPTLHLNTYDFAGQKEYRPMHHCFFTRRAMYLVVFNLQLLVSFIAEKLKEGPLEEIRYWLNSIHAHVHISSEQDKNMKRIFLVGTHLSPKDPKQGKPITEKELSEVNARLKDLFYDDEHSRSVNHLCFGTKGEIVMAVENSYDREDERGKSGAKALQDELRKVSKQLPFLNEVFPILWLSLESRLIQLREEHKKKGSALVMTMEKIEMLAKQCGIEDAEEIKAAMQFFHDTGTMVCLKELPTLFLKEWEKKQLEGLVLLDPKWLINIMRIVMELQHSDQHFLGEDLRDLKKTGIAKASLLKECWKNECDGNDEYFRQLCLMLQAYCFIFSLGWSARDADHISESFLVPCMLPDKQLEDYGLERITFYFDFCGFLPTEIYHRLLCLMLTESKGKTEFSATCCRFYNVGGSRWRIEMCSSQHVLKVSVIPHPKSGSSKPSSYVAVIHDEYLRRICSESGLQGLVYHGGPMVEKCHCQWKGVLPFVSYPEETEYSTDLECEKCLTGYDIDKLLDPEYEATSKAQPTAPPQTVFPQPPISMQHTGTPVVNYYVSAHQAFLPTDGGTVAATTQPGATASVQYPQVSAEKSFGSSPQPILPPSSHHYGDPQSPHPRDHLQQPLGAVHEFAKPLQLAEYQNVLVELKKALMNGYILANLTTCLASGAPGVGKTHLRHFLFRELPPILQTSTACIEQAQRAILRSLPAGATECEPVDGERLKGMIASDFKAGISLIDELEDHEFLSEISDTKGEEDLPSQQSRHHDNTSAPKSQQHDSTTTSLTTLHKTLTSPRTHTISITVCEPPGDLEQLEDDSQSEGEEIPGSQSETPSDHTDSRQHYSRTVSATPRDDSTMAMEDLLQLPETSEILKLMETSSASQQLNEVHWIHFIDSGGQAQFMDILPAFARNVSLQLPMIKLSEKLSDIPAAAYCDEQGKRHDLGRFIRTNEELLIQAAHFAMYHQPRFPFPNLEHTPDYPKVMVVGTFKDQENQEETIEDKNKLLMRSLELFQKQQILIPRSNREVIFPVDNTKAGQNPEDPVASELHTAIMRHAPRLRLKMPPQWYLLELELRKLGLRVISKKDCWAIAKKLQFESEETLDAALRYLHEANFFLYYPDILSDIVITDPSAVIDVITQLFEKHIKLREAPESDSQMISAEDERFRDQAVFTAETIESCNASYNKELLTNESLVNLLQHRHIIAKIAPETPGGVTSFFMPSLLQDSHTTEIIPPGVATPLHIVYPGNQCTPSGLYCAFMVGLLLSKSRFQWQIHPLHSTPIVSLQKSQIDFTINDHPGLVTLINAKTHYEVHVSSDFPANLVHHLLILIDDSLKLACSRFSYKVAHQFAFPCGCGDSPSHPAILIDRMTATMKCTQNPKYTEVMSKKQKLWLPQMKMKQDTSTHHRYDPAHPGVCFLGNPLLESVDSDGRDLPWPDVGISINIPPGAIPKGEIVHMDVWPCLQGPFVPPEGYELVSPVYQISPAFNFEKEVEVSVSHFAALQSDEDCDAMTFVSAQSVPHFEHSYPEYHFRNLKKGRFEKNSSTGRVTFKHFCKLAVARQQNHLKEKNLYSVQFYQDVTSQCNKAVFAISLCHPVHNVNLREMLNELFPGVKFWRSAKEPVMMSETRVKLVLPKVTGWDITPDKIPEEISRYEVDLPIRYPDLKSNPYAYPPRILLMIFPVGSDIRPIRCILEVHGFTEEVGFHLNLQKAQGSATGGFDTGNFLQVPSTATNALTGYVQLAQEPKMKDLYLLNFSDWYGVGLQLDVPESDLDVIEENHHDVKRCKREMFRVWLKITDQPTYVKLARALFLVDENNIAHRICRKYGIPEENVKPRSEDQ